MSDVGDVLAHYMNCCSQQRERAEKAEAEAGRIQARVEQLWAENDLLSDVVDAACDALVAQSPEEAEKILRAALRCYASGRRTPDE